MTPSNVSNKKLRGSANPFQATSPWLTRDEAAAWAKVGKSTICRWVDAGIIKTYKIKPAGKGRGVTRFKAADLDALFEAEGLENNEFLPNDV